MQFLILFLGGTLLVLNVPCVWAAPVAQVQKSSFSKLDAEIMEVEELKEPYGAAIYTVKDLVTGQTLRLFVDPHRSLIQIGGKLAAAGDALGGSKVTVIYCKLPNQDMPEVIFARVNSSFYS